MAQLEIEVSGLQVAAATSSTSRSARWRTSATPPAPAPPSWSTPREQVREQLTAEHAAAAEAERLKRCELEQQLSREKDKHQITAQKLLEARGKGREAEEQLQASAARNAELTVAARGPGGRRTPPRWQAAERAAGRGHRRAHRARGRARRSELETATTEWRHTDKQYEQLHKEMLVILDQRDEARRELDTIKQRFGLR